jgi:hypothetical protein
MRVSIVLVVLLLPLWPSLAQAQQQPAPIIGSLSLESQPPTTVTYPALNSQPFGTEHLGATGAAYGRGSRGTAFISGSTTTRKSLPSSRAASGKGSTIRHSSGFRSISTARSCSAGPASPCIA